MTLLGTVRVASWTTPSGQWQHNMPTASAVAATRQIQRHAESDRDPVTRVEQVRARRPEL